MSLRDNQRQTHEGHEAEGRQEVPLREDKALVECEPVDRAHYVVVFILLGDEVASNTDEQCLDGHADCPEADLL